MWSKARASWQPAERAALLDLLLAAQYRSVAQAARVLKEIAADEKLDSVGLRLDGIARTLGPVVPGDAHTLHEAWDEAATCPVGVGTPPLSCLRPDLPLQRSFRALRPEARLVLLAYAPQAGHRAILLDGTVLARRTGLPVSDVHRAAESLLLAGWMERAGDASPSIVHAWSAIFLPLTAGAWAQHGRRN
jgi:hypothetical protein